MLAAMELAEINSPRRIAHWLGQLGHESGGGKWMREIWGPTAAQLRYEPTTTLSKTLGNTNRGDGALFMGRGPIQNTGRSNYRQLTTLLREMLGDRVPDFEESPQLLETPQWGYLAAACYWMSRGLNRWCDANDIDTLTRRINGGTNGMPHRQALTARASYLVRADYGNH